jgi:hypothetical protein
LVKRRFDLSHGSVESLPLILQSRDGKRLACGHCVRFISNELAHEN